VERRSSAATNHRGTLSSRRLLEPPPILLDHTRAPPFWSEVVGRTRELCLGFCDQSFRSGREPSRECELTAEAGLLDPLAAILDVFESHALQASMRDFVYERRCDMSWRRCRVTNVILVYYYEAMVAPPLGDAGRHVVDPHPIRVLPQPRKRLLPIELEQFECGLDLVEHLIRVFAPDRDRHPLDLAAFREPEKQPDLERSAERPQPGAQPAAPSTHSTNSIVAGAVRMAPHRGASELCTDCATSA